MKLNYVSHIISKTNIIKYLKWIITFPSYFLSSFQIKFAITWFSMLRLLKSNIYHLFHIIQMLQNPTAQRLQLELPNDQFLNTFKSKVTATNEVIKNFSETAASSIRDHWTHPRGYITSPRHEIKKETKSASESSYRFYLNQKSYLPTSTIFLHYQPWNCKNFPRKHSSVIPRNQVILQTSKWTTFHENLLFLVCLEGARIS